MNKATLVARIAEKGGLERKQAEKALEAFVEVVQEGLLQDDKIQMIGFGTFELREREAHMGHNPATGEPMEVAATRTPIFKASKTFKDKF